MESKAKEKDIWEKDYLTLSEATEYFQIGQNKLREVLKKYRSVGAATTINRQILINRVRFEMLLDAVNEL
jgi:hypothetical protein